MASSIPQIFHIEICDSKAEAPRSDNDLEFWTFVMQYNKICTKLVWLALNRGLQNCNQCARCRYVVLSTHPVPNIPCNSVAQQRC
ncbi:hypothetical protein E2542_SST23966 [Spatholobus suberectus]|nr:hypothetical protein E2542_SST23966 [Spatholobus suberectus]